MSKKTNLDETQSVQLESKLSDFLSKNIKAVVSVSVAIIALIIVLIIVNSVNINNHEKSFETLSTVQTELSAAYSADSEAADYQANLDAALVKVEELKDKAGYVGYKATYLSASNSYNNKDYKTAMEGFLKISESAKGTYFGSLSLSNVIVCAEQLGDDVKAIEYCQQLIDTYGNEAAESPKTMFTLARIYEKQGNSDLAKSQFQQLADQFPSSEYAKLANNSLLNY